MGRGTGLTLEGGYNLILRRRWTVLLVPLLRMMHGAIRLRRRSLVGALRRHLESRPRPAAVLSVMPNFNGIIRDALAGAHPEVPFSVLLTDFADFPPRFWIEPGLGRVIVGTDRAASPGAADRPPRGADRARLGNGPPPALLPDGREGRARARPPRDADRGRLRGGPALRRQGVARDGAALRAAPRRLAGFPRHRDLRRQPGPPREARPPRGAVPRPLPPRGLHRPRRRLHGRGRPPRHEAGTGLARGSVPGASASRRGEGPPHDSPGALQHPLRRRARARSGGGRVDRDPGRGEIPRRRPGAPRAACARRSRHSLRTARSTR